jgi:hypothetical protein
MSDDERCCGQGVMERCRPGTDKFLDVLSELRELHIRKSLDYGCEEDALSNVRSSADVINVPAWAGCVLRMSDKMHRIRAFFRRGLVEFDGIEDTLLDFACYAIIALVVYRERNEPCKTGSHSLRTTAPESSTEHDRQGRPTAGPAPAGRWQQMS